jgi:hypothetical protein
MSNPKIIVTTESVKQTIQDLKDEGHRISIRTIRDKLGGGSLSTIHAKLKEIDTEIVEIPANTEAKLKPILDASVQLIKTIRKETATVAATEIELLKLNLDTMSEGLATAESERDEALAAAEAQKVANIELVGSIKFSEEQRKSTIERCQMLEEELTRLKIREPEYLEAKAEAAEARDRAARLEGRLEEIKRKIVK